MVPRALQDMPELRDDCTGYLDTFYTLSASRLVIQGSYQPIQISEVDSYLSRFAGISSGEERAKALYLIQKMDIVYLERKAKEQEQAAGKP